MSLPARSFEQHLAEAEQQPGKGRGSLPFPDESFQLVINRHESHYPAEVNRFLQRSGSFITQQVGAAHYQEPKRVFGMSPEPDRQWNAARIGWCA